MASLKLADNVPGLDFYEYREINFFGKFKYRARLHIDGLKYIYYRTLNIRQWEINVRNASSLVSENRRNEIYKNKELVQKFLDYYNLYNKTKKTNKDICIRLEGDTAAVFSNDLQILHKFKDWGTNLDIDFTEAKISTFTVTGIKLFKREPKNKFRVYFKTKRVDPNLWVEIESLLQTQKHLKPSNALQHWVKYNRAVKNSWKRRWLSSTYFIDYDDESFISYISLIHGDILGKKYELQKRPDTV